MAPPRPCSHPGCGVLVKSGRCERHQLQARSQAPDRRPSASMRGYGRRWQKYRAAFLADNPACSCGSPATVVDHIIPHKGDYALFWDRGNYQALCASCHSRKTAGNDGGFGNKQG